MSALQIRLYQQIYIIIQGRKVYLFNQLEEQIERLVYETLSMVTADEIIGVSAAPIYEILNIPPKQVVLLEELDGWEDGAIYYHLKHIKTQTIDFKDGFQLKTKPLSGMVKLPPVATCTINKLATTQGFMLNMNSKTINELYWLVEDLLAYTDLTGNHFDTEKAQVKLWKMNPILSKNDFPKIQQLQNNLLGQLEIPMAFDKAEFSKKVNELYEYLETVKK